MHSIVASGGIGNTTYGSRPPIVYDDTLNGSVGSGVGGVASVGSAHISTGRLLFDNDDELQKHMTNLSMHNHVGNVGITSTTSTLSNNGQQQIGSNSVGGGGGGSSNNIIDDDHHQQAAAVAAAAAAMRWRDPNLTEVISFLNNPNNVIKANAAAYLQHLCYIWMIQINKEHVH